MAKSKKIQWAEVYQCEIPAQANLITSILSAKGLHAKVQRKKENSNIVSFIKVKKNQAQNAKNLLLIHKLS